jgi:sulfur relay (sulfurtransferase) complex TusBCD TusD component (DsrE family)
MNALIILHADPDMRDGRALTALRLAGAMLADEKHVRLFLVEGGARLLDPALPADDPCCDLFHQLMEVGLDVQVCGATLRKLNWDESGLPRGVEKSSMKGLSGFVSEADEVVSF